MRALGIDLGSRRIGVAVTDRTGTLASPYEVVHRTGDRTQDHRTLVGLAEELEVERIVVGLPLSLDGSIQATRGVLPIAMDAFPIIGLPLHRRGRYL